MAISLSQAKALNGALSPTMFSQIKWLSLKEVKQLDKDQRYESALQISQQWTDGNTRVRQQAKEDFKNAAPKTKILTVIMFILCAYFLMAGIFNFFPCNYLAILTSKIFFGMFFPILNSAIMILITILIFKQIDKNIK